MVEVSIPYFVVAFVVVWAVGFVLLWYFERQSDREDEAVAAMLMSSGIVVGAVVLIVVIVALAWAMQTFAPIFG